MALELLSQLRAVGYPCSWGKTFSTNVWNMSRTPESLSDSDPEDSGLTSPSSEDDYL